MNIPTQYVIQYIEDLEAEEFLDARHAKILVELKDLLNRQNI